MTSWSVLIVDDDHAVRSLLRLTLPADGFEIREALDGQDALDQIEVKSPDLVLLDWNMPRRSGEDVLVELRQRSPGARVIVVTADRQVAQRHRAESLGADLVLTKPFSPLQLLDAIERLVPERILDRPP